MTVIFDKHWSGGWVSAKNGRGKSSSHQGLGDSKQGWERKAAVETSEKAQSFCPRTMFNVAITNQRVFAGRMIPLAEAELIAKAFGVSLNDVVLGTTAGAVRRYLQENNDLPLKSLVAGVPVSLRQAGNSDANNPAGFLTMTLATDLADPIARL